MKNFCFHSEIRPTLPTILNALQEFKNCSNQNIAMRLYHQSNKLHRNESVGLLAAIKVHNFIMHKNFKRQQNKLLPLKMLLYIRT